MPTRESQIKGYRSETRDGSMHRRRPRRRGRNNNVNKWRFLLVCLLLAGTADGTAAQQPGIDVARLIEDSAGGLLTQTRRVFELTVNEAIERALDRNLDIAVERVNPQLQDLTIAESRSAFLPNVSSNFDLGRSMSPSRSQLDGAGRLSRQTVETETENAGFGLEQALGWNGGRYTLDWTNGRTATNNVFFSFNPSFSSNVALSYTQPLLRGRSIDPQRRQLLVSQLNRDISDVDLRETIANTLADVRRAYWDLVYARASVDVQQQSLELAEQLVRDNRIRVEIGTLAPIEVVQARSEAAARRQSLAEAEQQLRTAELALKQLIVAGTDDELWNAEIDATDQPLLDQSPIDLEAAVRTALDARTDIERTRRQQDINTVTLRNLANATLPALDVVGSFRLQGQGGTQLISSALGGPALVTIPGGYGDALGHLLQLEYPVWNVQLQLSYPLGHSAQKAAHARARLQVQQTRAQIDQIELQIAAEVTNAALQIQSIRERIEAARVARELAEEQLAAEESKFEVGTSTNFFIVQAQRDLATARDTELRAILDYQNAVIEFERVQQTSLGRAGISIVGGG